MIASSTNADTWPIAAVSVRLTKTTKHKRFNTIQRREKRSFRLKRLFVFPWVIHELQKTIQKYKALKHGQMTKTEDQESSFPDTGYKASPDSDFWHSCIPTFSTVQEWNIHLPPESCHRAFLHYSIITLNTFCACLKKHQLPLGQKNFISFFLTDFNLGANAAACWRKQLVF